MKTEFRILLMMGLLALALAVVPGCSSDDDPVAADEPEEAPVFSLGAEEQIDLPAGLTASNDPMAQLVAGHMAQVNGLTSYASFFNPPTKAAAKAGPPWVFTWTYTHAPEIDVAFTLTVDETADSYTWTYMVDGYDEDHVYDHFVFYAAETAKNRSWGDIAVYDPEGNPLVPVLTWHWSTSALGVFSMVMESHDEDPVRLAWEIQPDGSGTLDVFEWYGNAWRAAWHFQWTALGSGSWIQYVYDGGENIIGTWSAGVTAKN